ncbi:hypothetical protein L596_001684 [Steinernema carpocapsae]|uniref:Tyr recombinase domain-containing protein n=1 Tax=Steinernema carpocapsae TaxID=34508 RepID=A0A4U8UMY8_STECR|nr:hypothetical protein L596_001684 [Steinernema carpocapsae]
MASYGRAAQKFQDWRLQPSLSPPSDTEVISYLTELYQSTSSATSVQSTATALSWFFKFSSSPNPCESPWVIAFLQGLRRSKPDTVHRKKISREHLRLILAADRQQLRDHRIVALLGVLYAACLRPTEGVTLTRDAISVDRVGLIISVAKDKTNKTGSPRQVPVQSGDSEDCPVRILRDWLRRAPDSPYVFPNLTKPSTCMSSDSARREWRSLAMKLGLPPDITLHGFRGGSATDSIKDGARIEEVMRFGRWKQPKTLEAYVEVSSATTPTASSLCKRLHRSKESDKPKP